MACTTCGKSAHPAPTVAHQAPDRHAFGCCSRCFFTSIIALLGSMMLAVASMFASLPRALSVLAVLPLALASVWLTLHVIGYLRHR